MNADGSASANVGSTEASAGAGAVEGDAGVEAFGECHWDRRRLRCVGGEHESRENRRVGREAGKGDGDVVLVSRCGHAGHLPILR